MISLKNFLLGSACFSGASLAPADAREIRDSIRTANDHAADHLPSDIAATYFIYNGIFTNGGFTPAPRLPTLTGKPQRILPNLAPLQSLYPSTPGTNLGVLFLSADTTRSNKPPSSGSISARTNRCHRIPRMSVDQCSPKLPDWSGVSSNELEVISPDLPRFDHPTVSSANLAFT